LIDRLQLRDLGGLTINWKGRAFATKYDVKLSDDSKVWETAYRVEKGNGGADNIYLSEADARYIRLDLLKSHSGNDYAISCIKVRSIAFGSSLNAFFDSVAQQAPKGYYPKYFTHEQSYWTVVGADGDSKSALINEQGQIEVAKSSFSLEPFIYAGDSLTTWHSVTTSQSLAKKYLPVPSVEWKARGLQLNVTAFASGKAGRSVLMVRYRLTNTGERRLHGKFLVAIRPFQVDPPWQFLNSLGGVTTISNISYHGESVEVDGKRVIPMSRPDGFGATGFDSGDITEYISRGILPKSDSVHDHFAHASAALAYSFDLARDSSWNVYIAVPFHEAVDGCTPDMTLPAEFVAGKLKTTERFWESKLDRVDIELPGTAQSIINTLKSNLAYIFINRDGPVLQPGTRSYDRSWIRDGSMMSAALLRFGDSRVVRDYIDWYSRYIYPSGKVPCVVDAYGADPVPENDSHGEYIYAVMQYFRFTHDTTWLRMKFASVVKVVRYIESLRRQEMTEKYRTGTPEERACYGLVPASISHEGYSNHPEHSYWDDFFVMLGLKDAASMARILGEKKFEKDLAAQRDDFRKCLYASMRLAMKNKNIDYIPGCVELGDFDATSTTVGIDPVGELRYIPEPQLTNTFEKYYKYFEARKDSTTMWDAYTPYETRIIGILVYLGERKKAQELTKFFMGDRRPLNWNEWPEVIWRDRDTPKFIGDMPHAWVGSDFIRSVRTMFVYEREHDSALVVGAGITGEWVSDTNRVVVRNLPTYWGKLNYTVGTQNGAVVYSLSGKIDMHECHLLVESPLDRPVRTAMVDGVSAKVLDGRSVEVKQLPARLELKYR
ncbi:MAG: discoidin domain-containing protein, partial [Bacteroidetes bacterium]|nr:discoidin domain-containing protein [Bacteroidota bacterium]